MIIDEEFVVNSMKESADRFRLRLLDSDMMKLVRIVRHD